ncbi:tetratricopeptide repeat protein [Roseateles sp. BYS78W]|uniref:Tetratricopeptide repeat protein n=1 Tax=Pelomonas candidula TaxID=3299025 RepID=A0ABW7H5H5_9BURK
MKGLLRSLSLVVLIWSLGCTAALAEDRSLLPKYGPGAKSEAEQAADARFVATLEEGFGGDRQKAAQAVAARGWKALREGKPEEAMRRFNQAWLLKPDNGEALWGMGAVQGGSGRMSEALGLFQEADAAMSGDIDFAADYARTLGMAGAEAHDDALLQQAFARFAAVQQRAPQHTLNLQNWAITLFAAGNYAEAWVKVKLAEATPRRAELDQGFIVELQKKMPRP